MKTKELIHDFITNYKDDVEKFQQAVISSLASLIYSEYITKIRQQKTPIEINWVPKIEAVRELLYPTSHLSKMMSEKFIEMIMHKPLFLNYIWNPSMKIFHPDNNNLELLRFTLDAYILPNTLRVIGDTIYRKFDLGNPDVQVFKESMDIDLFNRIPITDEQFEYIVDEALLQYIVLSDSIKKFYDKPSDNSKVYLVEDEILKINHGAAICPIYFDKDIIHNKSVMPLLSRATNTTIKDHDSTETILKNDKMVKLDINSAQSNELLCITLESV